MLLPEFETEYLPGTNLRGSMSGANWTFALPRLEFEQIVCLGTPQAAPLRTLCRLGRHVIVVAGNAADRERVTAVATANGLNNLATTTPVDPDELPFQDGSTDLLVLAETGGVRRLRRNRALRTECRRVLAADGLMYLESWSVLSPSLLRRQIESLNGEFGPAINLWLTPAAGEGKTIADSNDDRTRRYILDGRLDAPTVTHQSIKRLLRRNGKRPAGIGAEQRPQPAAAPAPAGHRRKRNIPALFRRAGRALIGRCQQIERAGRQSRMLSDRVHRTAFLIGAAAARLSAGPPEYLCRLAEEQGVDIAAHRWGIVAGDGYESRKVLMYLFRADEDHPQYIVKMTRHSRFNARLERECNALRNLHGRKLAPPDGLPEVVFAGTHGGLAIVAESMIDGVPFDRCPASISPAECAWDSARWLTHLGRQTATALSATPGQLAGHLERLLRQFCAAYNPPAALSRFLDRQLAALASIHAPVPLVFQHGDPGRWNVLVTPVGRPVFLDWESADANGLPLWDLFYFLRSYGVGTLRAAGSGSLVERASGSFLSESRLNEFIVEATGEYCRDVDLPFEAVAPMFYTCWMHRALKESTRLTPARLWSGHYVQFLQRCAESHHSPALQRLFAPA